MMKIDLNLPTSNPMPATDRPLRSTGAKVEAQRGAGSTMPDRAAIGGEVTAQFSAESAQLGQLISLVNSASELRRGHIDALRASIAQGTYQLSAERIADAMLSQATSKAR